MSEFEVSDLNRVKRVPKRGHYDRETVYQILDATSVCHIAFVHNERPMIIPTIYGREGDHVYFHGATSSRLVKVLESGVKISMAVTHVDGLVLARSVFNHSMNYRSAVLYGTAEIVSDENKERALKIVSEHILKGRWEEARRPSTKELKATSILKMNIETASAKIRTGAPVDDKEDYELPIWAGVLPYRTVIGDPVEDENMKMKMALPKSISDLK